MNCKIFPPQSIHEIGQRANQEDSIAQWDNRLFVLCDGMGGHEKGEVASQTVCQSLVKWFKEHVNPEEPFSDDWLRDALEYAYTELDKYADGNPRQMGTTLTLLYIHRQGVTAAHIGDSRIYHFSPPKLGGVRGGLSKGKNASGILYQSRDHSLVFDLFQAGEITYEEMATYPQKNIVTRAMTPGEDNRMRPDIIHITDIQPGDYFYMCSDGMLEQMSNDELVEILSANASDEEKRQRLIASTASNQDNHSAWLIHVEQVTHDEGVETLANEEPTARCNALNIKPVPVENSDVQIVDNEDDVTIVSTPPASKKKFHVPLNKVTIAALLCTILLFIAAMILFCSDNKEKEERPRPVLQIPIQRQTNIDSINQSNDSDKVEEDESAGD